MEELYFLTNGSSRWEDVQLVGGIHGVYPCHVYMVLGEYVGILPPLPVAAGPSLPRSVGNWHRYTCPVRQQLWAAGGL